MEKLGLRLRVFLFFSFLASGTLVIAAGALLLGWSRAELPLAPFVTAFVCVALLNTGMVLGVWLLFDENVAKPINRLSADLRMRVHGTVDTALEVAPARYLGDLAPAAAALSDKATLSLEDTAAHIARETERLGAERSRLSALLTESPVATIVVNPARQIVLYDAQAATILAEIATPRLKAPLEDYFAPACLDVAFSAISEATPEVAFDLRGVGERHEYSARVKALGKDGHMLFVDPPASMEVLETIAARPLVFDFDLMDARQETALEDCPLSELCFVVLDLETTGLSVTKDAIIQIGAVRVLNGAVVAGEQISTFVDPDRPIPPASTRIHHITDAEVKGAPKIGQACQMLHHFARDAVLVAHNAPFDIGLLQHNGSQMEVEWDHPVLDTVLLSAVVFGTTEEHTLDALCDRLSITIPEADRHTALGDAKATADALVCLLKILEGRGYRTFGDLQKELARQAQRLYSAA